MAIPRKKPFQITANENERAEGLPWQAYGVSVNNMSAQWLDLGGQRFIGPSSRGTFALDGDQVATFKWNAPPGVVQPIAIAGQIATLVYTDQLLPDAGGPILGNTVAAQTVLERFARANIPAFGNAGRMIQLTDDSRSVLVDTGTAWVAVDGFKIDATAYGADGASGDNSAALQAAINALPATGGTIHLSRPVGGVYQYGTTLDLSGRYGIIIEGEQGASGGAGTATVLQFTGAGSAFNCQSSSGLVFRDLRVKYTNALCTRVFDMRGALGSDTALNTLSRVMVDSSGPRTAIGVDLDKAIMTTIERCYFWNCTWAISGAAAGGYSNAIQIRECTFHNNLNGAIRDNNQGWIVTGNTFEPNSGGGVVAIAPVNALMNGLVFTGNWIGDQGASATVQIQVSGYSADIRGNFIGGGANSTGIQVLGNCSGIVIEANDFEQQSIAILLSAGVLSENYRVGPNRYTGCVTNISGRPANPMSTFPNAACRAYNNAAQAIPTGAVTAVALNNELFDTEAMHDNAVNNSRITIATAGKYMIVANLQFAASAAGTLREVLVQINGGAIAIASQRLPPPPAGVCRISVTTTWNFIAGDYVEMFAFHDVGVNLNVDANPYISPDLSVIKMLP